MANCSKTIASCRGQFPVALEWAYFDTASTGLIPDFVYDGTIKSLDIDLTGLVQGYTTPTVNVSYLNGNSEFISADEIVDAGTYYATITGVNDANYKVTNLAEWEDYSF